MSAKRFPWASLALLMVCYASFGWYLAGLPSPKPTWLIAECYQMIGEPMLTEPQARQEPTGMQKRSQSSSAVNPEVSPMPNGNKASKTLTPQPSNLCQLALVHNLFTAILAISWIIVSSIAFIAPLTSFSAFVNRWFRSDTVAFTAIFLLAALAAVMLYWLHVFTQILTILAAETLARIDLQTRDVNGMQSFWLLTTVCLIGLGFGWSCNTIW